AWLGKQIRIGDINITCTAPAPRCGAITQAQRHFDFDKRILRSVVRDAEQNLGVYGAIEGAGSLRVGDAVLVG
ncbi:MAG: MOSC domain-containing protein, partial [Pseudomonas sp.]